MIKLIVKTYGSDASGTKTQQGEFYGLSTDNKAECESQTGRAPENADLFYEMDTGAAFLYDEDGARWLPQ